MSALIIRLVVLALVAISGWLLVRAGKHFVAVETSTRTCCPANASYE